jgi:phosphomannomutase
LKNTYPQYFMGKKKIELTPGLDVDSLLADMASRYRNEEISTVDGVKIDFPKGWVHMRKSNTEPIIRVYTEAPSLEEAEDLADRFVSEIREMASR